MPKPSKAAIKAESAKDGVRRAVDAALEAGKKHLLDFQSGQGRMLPPPPPLQASAQAALREHFFAALRSTDNPSLYSAILQHWLVNAIGMPFPRHVFKEDFYELTTGALSPD